MTEKSKKIMVLVVSCLMVLSMILFFSRSILAQEEKLFHSPVDTYRYTVYSYPAGESYFYLPSNYQVKFDAHNGKFFMIKYDEWVCDGFLRLEILFYTPNDELFGRVFVEKAYIGHCIPHKHNPDNTLKYDSIKIKIVNHSGHNKDFKFIIYDPTNPVKGHPVPLPKDC